MESASDFKTLQSTVTSALVETTNSVKDLTTEDLAFHRSFDPSLRREIEAQNLRLLKLAERVLDNATAGAQSVGPQLQDVDAIDTKWKEVIDVVDSLLERTDTSLDEFAGIIKRASTPTAETAPMSKRPGQGQWRRDNNLRKPQSDFDVVPKNDEASIFKPLLTRKPHATIPLEQSLRKILNEDGLLAYEHPYKTEIEQYNYPDSTYSEAEPIPYPPFESTSAIFVDTEEGLATMLAELRAAKEIAIDLEHHDLRTYIGLTCLIQISTRNKDWIVDTLKPWRRRLEVLNEVFADPSILKVFHGAQSDMIWLQRDFGLYVVGYFDTYHAARALRYPGGSLAYLLQRYVNFNAQKQYQMADWRVRPLPQELFEYARSDTHFLLYVYDHMRNELLQTAAQSGDDLIQQVLDNSKAYALQRYENPVYDAKFGMGPVGWYRQIAKTPALLSKEQFSVFRAVHQWRNDLARAEDESTLYIMPNHTLFELARSMPTDRAALFNIILRPSSPVRQRMDELLAVIVEAKEVGANGPAMGTIMAEADALADRQRATRRAAYASIAPAHANQAAAASSPKEPTSSVATAGRANESLLWGDTLSSLADLRQPKSSRNVRPNFDVPHLPHEGERFIDNQPGSGMTTMNAEPAAPNPPLANQIAAETSNKIFVLRHLGGPKKRTAAEAGLDNGLATSSTDNPGVGDAESDIVSSDHESESGEEDYAAEGIGFDPFVQDQDLAAARVPTTGERKMATQEDWEAGEVEPAILPDLKAARKQRQKQRRAERKQRRAERKQRQKERKANEPDYTRSVHGEPDVGGFPAAYRPQAPAQAQPFDYANAPSVLYAGQQNGGAAQQAGQGKKKGRKNHKHKQKALNPYADALGAAPSGMPRAQKPKAGRSGTWAAGP